MKKPRRAADKPPKSTPEAIKGAPKSAYELVMERLRATDRAAGTAETSLTPAQKKDIAEARRVAAARLAEREILFNDTMRKSEDPAEREKAEREYETDRRRIHDDCERAIDAIRGHRA